MVIIVFTYLWVLFRTGYRGRGGGKGGFVGLGIGVFVEIKSRYMMAKVGCPGFFCFFFFVIFFFLLFACWELGVPKKWY